jgi:hypothetical protein
MIVRSNEAQSLRRMAGVLKSHAAPPEITDPGCKGSVLHESLKRISQKSSALNASNGGTMHRTQFVSSMRAEELARESLRWQ